MAGTIRLRTVVRDCLYLNWALPLRRLPPLPDGLRYEEHGWQGEAHGFVSALLFRHDRLQVGEWPLLRVSYPQFNLRLYVRDGDDVPAVFFRTVLVPGWVVPAARWIGGHPVQAGRFRFPRPTDIPQREPWHWRVRRGDRLGVRGSVGPPSPGAGPVLGSWERTVAYFRQRQRGYYPSAGGLRRAKTSHRSVPVWPLRAEIEDGALLRAALPADEPWPALHSAWLCPEIPFVFELGGADVRESLRRRAGPVAADPAMRIGRPRERAVGEAREPRGLAGAA